MGRVVSSRTGEPLAAVHVLVPGASRGSLTDGSGRYLIANVPAGTREVVAQSLGYARKTVTGVQVHPCEAATLDISLDPEAVALEGVTVSAARERGNASALLSDRRKASGARSGSSTTCWSWAGPTRSSATRPIDT